MPSTAPAARTADAIRITRGHPSPEELAAVLTALLCTAARPAAGSSDAAEVVPLAGWRRPDRIPGHRGPRSWRGEHRRTRPGSLPPAA